MFIDRLKKLCNDRGISPYKACTDVGLNRAAVAKWKNGSKPNGATAIRLAEYFNVSVDYLLGQDDDITAIQNAKIELKRMVELYPDMPSGRRVELLFYFTRFDHVVVAYNLNINLSDLENWMNLESLPDEDTLEKTLDFFNICGADLLPHDEAVYYEVPVKDFTDYNKEDALSTVYHCAPPNQKNLIRIAGRDGSYEERFLTDQQFSALKAILAQMPDASGDL